MKKVGLRIALAGLLGLALTPAWGYRCKAQAERSESISAEGVAAVEIFALAGELEVRGDAETGEVRAQGRACVSREDMLPAIGITVRRLADRVQVLAEMPDISGETERRWEGELAIMDLEVRLPAGVAVIVHDSSGDLSVRDVASLEVSDSSGEIDIEDVAGDVLVPRDSSGDILMRRVGAVTIEVDSSGDIRIEDAASVTIANDTSGDIALDDVAGDVLIGNDSSGRIAVRNIGGSFVVENDTSGGIRFSNVQGAVSVPEQRVPTD
jgi:hypothetical protein